MKALLAVAALVLAGCTASYPDAYLAKPGLLGGDLELATGSEVQDLMEDLGMESNPGDIATEEFDLAFSVTPNDAYGALYQLRSDPDAILLNVILRFDSARDAMEWLDETDICDGSGGVVLRDGAVVAGYVPYTDFAPGVIAAARDAADRVQRRTGAEPVCGAPAAPSDVITINAGRHGPYDVGPGEEQWFEFRLTSGRSVSIETDVRGNDDTEMWLYQDGDVLQYNDDCVELESCIMTYLSAGTYQVRVTSYGQDEFVDGYYLVLDY